MKDSSADDVLTRFIMSAERASSRKQNVRSIILKDVTAESEVHRSNFP